MPTEQFAHVVSTLKSLPEHLTEQGQQALSEIKGAIAKEIYKAGDSGGTQNGPSMWNAANVTRRLNDMRSKMGMVFTPEEVAKFQTLNDGGHILQTPSAYPGAAVQGHNLLQRGLILAPPAAGAAIGHWIGGEVGGHCGRRHRRIDKRKDGDPRRRDASQQAAASTLQSEGAAG